MRNLRSKQFRRNTNEIILKSIVENPQTTDLDTPIVPSTLFILAIMVQVTAKSDCIGRVLFVGSPHHRTGMSSLIHRMTRSTFSHAHKQVLDYEEMALSMSAEGESEKRLRMQFWEPLRSERRFLYKHWYEKHRDRFDALVLCYDIREPESFSFLRSWFQEYSGWWTKNASEISSPCFVLLCGTKRDLAGPGERVPTEDGQSFANHCGMDGFLETSSLTGTNTEVLFQMLCSALLERIAMNPPEKRNETKPKSTKSRREWWNDNARHVVFVAIISWCIWCWFWPDQMIFFLT